jgi:hypothetical protein
MTQYVNINKCKSFKQELVSTPSPGTPLESQLCSEVILVNRTGNDITLFDSGNDDVSNGFLLANLESITLRGITNTDQVSAVGVGDIYYRAQFYSNTPSR